MSNTLHIRRVRRAFTLIELLVVIGIIAILMTLAVPMIGRGLQFANRTRCASNLKQLGLAVALYMDHNPRNPRNYFPPQLGLATPSFTHWREAITNFLQDAGAAAELFSCPSSQYASSNSTYSAHPILFERMATGKGLNFSVVRRPTAVLMIGDAKQPSASSDAALLFSGFSTNSNPSKSEELLPSGNVAFRHSYQSKMSAIFVFADGHAEPVQTNNLKRKNVDLGY